MRSGGDLPRVDPALLHDDLDLLLVLLPVVLVLLGGHVVGGAVGVGLV